MKIHLIPLLMTAALAGWSVAADAPPKPNIVLIMTDDMGFSDIGCYGGEIQTPNIDKLANSGLKFSQFYNSAKCEPSRAALLTGQQWWTYSKDIAVRKDSPNLGEVMRPAGYRTMMVGKWHVEGNPFERGFDRHFGFMGGGTDSFKGDDSFTLDGKPWKVPSEGFYATTALTDHAVKFMKDEKASHPEKPFFLYVAYNAPHSSIMAPKEDVAKYRGKYLKGWDVVRRERFEKQKALGLAGPGWTFSDRPKEIPAWDTLDEKSKDFEDLRMSTYAAMVDCVDQGVGRIVQTLEELGVRENTLVIFMNDNGASANDRARSGEFGTPGSRWNVGAAWAHVSNTPFKYYKRSQHAGGVTTPFIANWPASIKPKKEYEDQPCHIIDIMPTFTQLSGADYPMDFGGKPQVKLAGVSLVPILKESAKLPERTIHFSLFNNMAVVDRGWRMATSYGQPWELYDLTKDRTETQNLAKSNPEKFQEMLEIQKNFEKQTEVRLRLGSGEPVPGYAPIYREDGRIAPSAKEKIDNPGLSLQVAKLRSTGVEPNAAELAALDGKSKPAQEDAPAPKKKKKKKKSADTE